jgi:23S rRNA (adenine2503-C2)-methyltransferase
MELIREFGKDKLARLYVLRLRPGDDHLVECVESLQPPRPRSEKWVLIVSTLFGCPVGCRMCDAGGWYGGKLAAGEILEQIRFMVRKRFGASRVPSKKFKIQFARMGEPALNPAVLDVLEQLPDALDAPGLLPSVSSVAPHGTERFFDRLKEIKTRLYPAGRFQLQFSLHSTDPEARRSVVPVKVLPFEWMARYAGAFLEQGDQRITLNFAAASDLPVEPEKLLPHFDPGRFLIKLTPLNPTQRASQAGLSSVIDAHRPSSANELVQRFESAGYRVILSIGETEENAIGSNCGQYVTCVKNGKLCIRTGYEADRYAS